MLSAPSAGGPGLAHRGHRPRQALPNDLSFTLMRIPEMNPSSIHACAAGMHGAALAWTLLMAPHTAAVELWPQPEGIWRCYEHFSHWAGLLYRYWPALCRSAEYARPPVQSSWAMCRWGAVSMLAPLLPLR